MTALEYRGLKLRPQVQAGDEVVRGACLAVDKYHEAVRLLSPAGGTVESIERGPRRALHAIVIRVGEADARPERLFAPRTREEIHKMSRAEVVDAVLQGGLWPAIKTRPYGKVPDPQSEPSAIFVSAMDTRPLAPPASLVINESPQAFTTGLEVLAHLSAGKVYVCHAPAAEPPKATGEKVRYAQFQGAHPAGLSGTHIHFIEPLAAGKTVWTLDYQDVIALGRLLKSGEYPTERMIALAGPAVANPRLLHTRLGASVDELCEGELRDGENRVVVGSVLDGIEAKGAGGFLHRFASQVAALPLRPERKLMAWVRPGMDMFSVANVLLSKLNPKRKFAFNCGYNGDPRGIVPIGLYERVLPMPFATQLLKSLLVGDIEMAQKLGCLGLDEEDLAVCSYVCPGKHDFGRILRSNLERIEQDS